MYPSIIREGEEVFSPTGRRWVVTGRALGSQHVDLIAADGSGEECSLLPKLLRHAGGKLAGPRLHEIDRDEHTAKLLDKARRILHLPTKLVSGSEGK